MRELVHRQQVDMQVSDTLQQQPMLDAANDTWALATVLFVLLISGSSDITALHVWPHWPGHDRGQQAGG